VIGEGNKDITFNTTILAAGEMVADATEEMEIGPPSPTLVKPATCKLYGVQDGGLNNSQFFTINPVDETVEPLGDVYKGYDIEAMDVHPETNILYVASGDNTKNHPKGHLYKLDAETGQLMAIGATGFKEISSLAFNANGELWGWAKDAGLIQIDPVSGIGTEVLESKAKLEDLTWSLDGAILYGSVATELYAYEAGSGAITQKCTNLPLETEALEMLADGLMLLGMHKDKTLTLHALEVTSCEMVESRDVAVPYNDPEGIAMPTAACQQ